MTFSGAVNFCLAGVRNLPNCEMALPAAKLTVRGVEKLFLVNMEHSKPVRLFKPYKSRVLVTGETASLIQGKAVIRHRRNKIE